MDKFEALEKAEKQAVGLVSLISKLLSPGPKGTQQERQDLLNEYLTSIQDIESAFNTACDASSKRNLPIAHDLHLVELEVNQLKAIRNELALFPDKHAASS